MFDLSVFGTAEGWWISLRYIYFAMAFSLLVEMINLRVRRTQSKPVKLHSPYRDAPERERPSVA